MKIKRRRKHYLIIHLMSISPVIKLEIFKPRTQKFIEEKHRQNVQEKLKVTKPNQKRRNMKRTKSQKHSI